MLYRPCEGSLLALGCFMEEGGPYKLPRPNMNIKLIFFLIFVLSPTSCGIGRIKTIMSSAMLTLPVA